MNLTVVIGKRTLLCVANEAGNGCKSKTERSPNLGCTWHCLVPESQRDCQVDGKKPCVAGKAVQASPLHGALVGEPGELSVGRVAKVCQHQKYYTYYIIAQILKIEHSPCCHAQDDRQKGYGVWRNAQAVPQQGESQPDGSREVHIDPLFRVVRFHGSL